MSDTFQGFTPRTIDFMWMLRLNNNRTWFEANKENFRLDFQRPMQALAGCVHGQMTALYPRHGLGVKVSRIYKDARRVRDGEPYRCNLWFSMERPSQQWTATPVFWFELAPDSWSYGLGYYQAKPVTMAKLRARIDCDPGRFEALIAPLEAQNEFVLEGPQYARKKEGPTPKTQPWYNRKSLSLIHTQPNGEELYAPALAQRLLDGYRFLMPFYDAFITLEADSEPDSV